ncbi:hypothetical protein ACW7EJ_01145, partial [Acinetobacter soli]
LPEAGELRSSDEAKPSIQGTTGEKLADLQDKKNEEISHKEDVTVVEDAIQERGTTDSSKDPLETTFRPSRVHLVPTHRLIRQDV